MTTHSIGNDQKTAAGMAALLFLRGGEGAEVLVFRTNQSNVRAKDRSHNESSVRNGTLCCRLFAHLQIAPPEPTLKPELLWGGH